MKKSPGKPRVLIAEDIEFSRKILRMLLRFDYEVAEAGDGDEAIRLLEADPRGYDCVLLDLKMPGTDGFGVLDYMQANGLVERIPVIALTSVTAAEGHIRCYECGAVDVIEKPYKEDLLLYKLKWNIARFRRGKTARVPSPPGDPAGRYDRFAEHCRRAYGLTDEGEVRAFHGRFQKALADCAARLRALDAVRADFVAVRDVTHDLGGFVANAGASDLADENTLLNAAAKAENAKAVRAGIHRTLALCEAYCET